jgi:hypothetical protein
MLHFIFLITNMAFDFPLLLCERKIHNVLPPFTIIRYFGFFFRKYIYLKMFQCVDVLISGPYIVHCEISKTSYNVYGGGSIG